MTLEGAASIWVPELICARARSGDHAGAWTLLSGLIERAARDYVSPTISPSRSPASATPSPRSISSSGRSMNG